MDLAILKVLAVIVCVISTVVNCAVVVTVFQARKQRLLIFCSVEFSANLPSNFLKFLLQSHQHSNR